MCEVIAHSPNCRGAFSTSDEVMPHDARSKNERGVIALRRFESLRRAFAGCRKNDGYFPSFRKGPGKKRLRSLLNYIWNLVCVLRFGIAGGLKGSFDSGLDPLKLGRESAYATGGLLVLAKKPFGTVMLLRDIARAAGVSQNFLAKIFQKLARGGIVTSSRGAVRGYFLARRPKDIRAKEIFLAVEGSDLFDRCIFWRDRCADSNPCPLHFRWKKARDRVIRELMERTTLADLIRDAAK